MEEKYISQYLIFQQHCEFGEMENQRIKIKKRKEETNVQHNSTQTSHVAVLHM